MKPYLINTSTTRLAIRDNGDGRAWLMAGSECLLTPEQAKTAGQWLLDWAEAAFQSQAVRDEMDALDSDT